MEVEGPRDGWVRGEAFTNSSWRDVDSAPDAAVRRGDPLAVGAQGLPDLGSSERMRCRAIEPALRPPDGDEVTTLCRGLGRPSREYQPAAAGPDLSSPG